MQKLITHINENPEEKLKMFYSRAQFKLCVEKFGSRFATFSPEWSDLRDFAKTLEFRLELEKPTELEGYLFGYVSGVKWVFGIVDETQPLCICHPRVTILRPSPYKIKFRGLLPSRGDRGVVNMMNFFYRFMDTDGYKRRGNVDGVMTKPLYWRGECTPEIQKKFYMNVENYIYSLIYETFTSQQFAPKYGFNIESWKMVWSYTQIDDRPEDVIASKSYDSSVGMGLAVGHVIDALVKYLKGDFVNYPDKTIRIYFEAVEDCELTINMKKVLFTL